MVIFYWAELALGIVFIGMTLLFRRRLLRAASPDQQRRGRLLPLFLVPFLLWVFHAGYHVWVWPQGAGLSLNERVISILLTLYLVPVGLLLSRRAG